MSALTADRNIEAPIDPVPDYTGLTFNVAAAVTIYGGSLVFIDSSGNATPTPSATTKCAGVNDGSTIDNSTGSAGDKTIKPRRRSINLGNNGTSIADDDIGRLAYAVDNQTVDLSSSGGTRCAVGPIEGVNADGEVLVLAGFPMTSAMANEEAESLAGAPVVTYEAWATGSNEFSLGALTTGLLKHTVSGSVSTPATAVDKTDYIAPATLAANTATNGASLVGIQDAGSFLTATTVEAALAEIAPTVMVEIADPGDAAAIPVTQSADIQMTTGGSGETGSLPDPARVGLTLHLRLTTDGGGNRVVTAASGVNATGNTTLTFADAGDSIILLSTRDAAAAYCWRVVANDGVALS